MTTHELKIARKYFKAVTSLVKTFEIRYNDRDYRTGDILKLRAYDHRTNIHTGDETRFRITYILSHKEIQGLTPGFVALAIVPAYPLSH